MTSYIKFWLAKMLVEIVPLLIIFALFAVTFIVLLVREYWRIWRRGR